jgi:hypothetical protein
MAHFLFSIFFHSLSFYLIFLKKIRKIFQNNFILSLNFLLLFIKIFKHNLHYALFADEIML